MKNYLKSMLAVVAVAAAPFIVSGTPAQAQETSSLQAIIDSGELKVGVMQAPPWFYKDPLGDEWTGVGASVGKAMAETLGVEFKPVEVTWATSIAALQANKIDVQFVLDATPVRALAIDFPSSPLLNYALAVLADEDIDASSWEKMNREDMKISVAKGTTMEAYVKKHLPKAEILSFPGNAEALAAFQSGRVNAVCLFHPPLITMRKNIGRGQIAIPTPIRASASSAGVRKEADKSFRDWVSTTISYMYETGQTQGLYEDFLVSFDVDPATVPAIRKDLWD
ncbi:MAG: transporter substrate-binding domain-containing protein [Sulfitobacter sp.]